MGTSNISAPPRAGLADALFPKVRQRVLAVLFNEPERSFFMGEIIARARSGTGAVQRELVGLAAAGILSVHKQGKQKHYQANSDGPIFAALSALVSKTIGVVNVLRASLQPLERQVAAAFLYDEASATTNSGPVTIHVVLFSKNADGDAGAIAQAMQNAANTLARPVSFTSHTPKTLADAIAKDDNFMSHLLLPTHTWIVGGEDALFDRPT